MYKVAILGCNRGVVHGAGYQYERNARVVAMADRNETLREGAKALFPKVNMYDDYNEMMDCEHPDILHIVTNPNIPRHIWLDKAIEINTPLICFEKPLALLPPELEIFVEKMKSYRGKVVVNHQRQFFPFSATLRWLLHLKALGGIKNVLVIATGEVMEMGTHIMDLLLMTNQYTKIKNIYASTMGTSLSDHPLYRCPDSLSFVCSLSSCDNAVGTYYCGLKPLHPPDYIGMLPMRLASEYKEHFATRCEMWVFGENGHFWWKEYGTWGYKTEYGSYMCPSDFIMIDNYAQQQLSKANIKWLENEDYTHPCCVDKAILGLNTIFDAYVIGGYDV